MASESNERGTPAYIIDAARRVMGAIDLDPASTAEANRIGQATTFYTREDNGLIRPWYGRVWLNPPFSMPLVEQFTGRAIAAYEHGAVKQAIVLVNVSTGRWYHRLLEAYPAVYPKHHSYHPNARIEFYTLTGNHRGKDNNSRGQAIFYLGPHIDRFFDVFGEFCTIPWRWCD